MQAVLLPMLKTSPVQLSTEIAPVMTVVVLLGQN